MTWFKTLTGFQEDSPDGVREKVVVEGDRLRSLVNGNTFKYGALETPTLGELRERVKASDRKSGEIQLREVVGNVQELHRDASNAGATFQVASQFNLLEMVSPYYTPEQGIGIYENDPTQGPACAIAAGAGTIYRNYFAPVNGEIGQSATNQIDCLADIGAAMGNDENRLWQMRNGYALATEIGLEEISDSLGSMTEQTRDELRTLLRIGIQWDTQVTVGHADHTVSQAYCSALPVTYSPHPADMWEAFARLILEASYEATICVAILNSAKTGNNSLFLTLLGGGAFGNKTEWIISAIDRALRQHIELPLDVAIVSYGSSREAARNLVDQVSNR